MKYLLAFTLLLMVVTSNAQTPPPNYPKDASTGLIDYTEAISVEGADKSALFTRAKVWLAASFHSVKDVVQVENK